MDLLRAESIADALIGMDDAKKELIVAYLNDDNRDPQAVTSAAERWEENFLRLSDLLDT